MRAHQILYAMSATALTCAGINGASALSRTPYYFFAAVSCGKRLATPENEKTGFSAIGPR